MTTSYQKPTTQEQLISDRDAHPDRGRIDGKDIVRFDTVEVSGDISRQLCRLLLQTAASMGMSKEDAVVAAIQCWVSQPENRAMREEFITHVMEIRDVPRSEAVSKIYGSYKKLGRTQRLNHIDT